MRYLVAMAMLIALAGCQTPSSSFEGYQNTHGECRTDTECEQLWARWTVE